MCFYVKTSYVNYVSKEKAATELNQLRLFVLSKYGKI
jgi:hypothetical protein